MRWAANEQHMHIKSYIKLKDVLKEVLICQAPTNNNNLHQHRPMTERIHKLAQKCPKKS